MSETVDELLKRRAGDLANIAEDWAEDGPSSVIAIRFATFTLREIADEIEQALAASEQSA